MEYILIRLKLLKGRARLRYLREKRKVIEGIIDFIILIKSRK